MKADAARQHDEIDYPVEMVSLQRESLEHDSSSERSSRTPSTTSTTQPISDTVDMDEDDFVEEATEYFGESRRLDSDEDYQEEEQDEEDEEDDEFDLIVTRKRPTRKTPPRKAKTTNTQQVKNTRSTRTTRAASVRF